MQCIYSMKQGKNHWESVEYVKPFEKERYEPLPLQLPLPSPDYYYEAPKREAEPETSVERGVWTIDI